LGQTKNVKMVFAASLALVAHRMPTQLVVNTTQINQSWRYKLVAVK